MLPFDVHFILIYVDLPRKNWSSYFYKLQVIPFHSLIKISKVVNFSRFRLGFRTAINSSFEEMLLEPNIV